MSKKRFSSQPRVTLSSHTYSLPEEASEVYGKGRIASITQRTNLLESGHKIGWDVNFQN